MQLSWSLLRHVLLFCDEETACSLAQVNRFMSVHMRTTRLQAPQLLEAGGVGADADAALLARVQELEAHFKALTHTLHSYPTMPLLQQTPSEAKKAEAEAETEAVAGTKALTRSVSLELSRSLSFSQLTRRVLLIGHRGARGFVPPGNTMASFREAVRRGCDVIELDVVATKDKQLIVEHDAFTERTGTRIRNMTVAELEAELSLPLPEQRLGTDAGTDVKVLRLETVLRALGPRPISTAASRATGGKSSLAASEGASRLPANLLHSTSGGSSRGVAIYFDIKDRAVVPLLGPLLLRGAREGFWPADRTIVASFDVRDVQRFVAFRAANPELRASRAAHLIDGVLLNMIPQAVSLGVDAISMAMDYMEPVMVLEAHSAGLDVFCWRVQSVAAAQQLVKMGVDGICTDFPTHEWVSLPPAVPAPAVAASAPPTARGTGVDGPSAADGGSDYVVGGGDLGDGNGEDDGGPDTGPDPDRPRKAQEDVILSMTLPLAGPSKGRRKQHTTNDSDSMLGGHTLVDHDAHTPSLSGRVSAAAPYPPVPPAASQNAAAKTQCVANVDGSSGGAGSMTSCAEAGAGRGEGGDSAEDEDLPELTVPNRLAVRYPLFWRGFRQDCIVALVIAETWLWLHAPPQESSTTSSSVGPQIPRIPSSSSSARLAALSGVDSVPVHERVQIMVDALYMSLHRHMLGDQYGDMSPNRRKATSTRAGSTYEEGSCVRVLQAPVDPEKSVGMLFCPSPLLPHEMLLRW